MGGSGDDIFCYREASDSGVTVRTRDVIEDFDVGRGGYPADVIDLSGLIPYPSLRSSCSRGPRFDSDA